MTKKVDAICISGSRLEYLNDSLANIKNSFNPDNKKHIFIRGTVSSEENLLLVLNIISNDPDIKDYDIRILDSEHDEKPYFYEINEEYPFNFKPLFRNIYLCSAMAQQYEAKHGYVYQHVLRIRADVNIEKEFDYMKFPLKPNTVYVPSDLYGISDDDEKFDPNWLGMSDQVFIGERNSMYKISSGFYFVNDVDLPEEKHFAECFVYKWATHHCGLSVKSIGFQFTLDRSKNKI